MKKRFHSTARLVIRRFQTFETATASQKTCDDGGDIDSIVIEAKTAASVKNGLMIRFV